jgi:hypothetical protein
MLRKEAPWIMVMMVVKDFPVLPAVAFCSIPLCPMSTSPKTLLLITVVTTSISVNRTAQQMEGKCQQLKQDVEGVNPWDFFLWPQNNLKNFDGSYMLHQCIKTKRSVHCKTLETI